MPRHLKLGAQFIEKQRLDQLENVFFAGVMGTELTPQVFVVIHPFKVNHALKHGAENRRRNFAPVGIAAVEQKIAHGRVEAGGADFFLEQPAIYIGVILEPGGNGLLSFPEFGIQFIKQLAQHRAQIAAIRAGAALDQVGKLAGRFKQTGAVGEQAKQQTHQQQLQPVAGIAIAPQRVVQA